MLWEESKLKFKATGFFCSGGSGEFENGTLKGESILEGENTAGEQINLWVE